MASLGGNNKLALDASLQTILAGVAFAVFGSVCIFKVFSKSSLESDQPPSVLKSFLLFFYSCFIKPHNGDKKGTQQDALESFYKKQAGAYDATRRLLLQGREDMLALSAAQLQAKAQAEAQVKRRGNTKRIWVDVRLSILSFTHIAMLTHFPGWRRDWLEHRCHVRLCERARVLLQWLPRRLLSISL